MSVYLAYALLIAHVALGTAQFDKDPELLIAVSLGAALITGLHITAALGGRAADNPANPSEGWMCVGDPMNIPLNRAITVTPPEGERIAVFRHAKGLSAIMAVCSHQNGPLGEGCVLEGLITCPWHGFQFDPETGAAPPPFEDKVKTHELKLKDGEIWVRAKPDPWGTVRKAVTI